MAKIICFKHSHYKGKDAPELSCEVCCSLFINNIRERKRNQQEALEKTKKQKKKATH